MLQPVVVLRRVGIVREAEIVVVEGSLAGCLSRQRGNLVVVGYMIVLQEELGTEGRQVRL